MSRIWRALLQGNHEKLAMADCSPVWNVKIIPSVLRAAWEWAAPDIDNYDSLVWCLLKRADHCHSNYFAFSASILINQDMSAPRDTVQLSPSLCTLTSSEGCRKMKVCTQTVGCNQGVATEHYRVGGETTTATLSLATFQGGNFIVMKVLPRLQWR